MKREKPKWITMVRRADGSAVPFKSLSPEEQSRIAVNIDRKATTILARSLGLEAHFTEEPLEKVE